MREGDIVLVPFPFTDLRSGKKRPALVLVVEDLEVTVCSGSPLKTLLDLFYRLQYQLQLFQNYD